MTQDTHFHCPLLRVRLIQLHRGGMTWVRMQQKSGVNQTTISRYAQGMAGVEPETYHKLRNALAKELPVIGTPEHEAAIHSLSWANLIPTVYPTNTNPEVAAATEPPRPLPPAVHLQVECSSWFINLQGELVAQNASILSGELVSG